jgi:predicted deacylase
LKRLPPGIDIASGETKKTTFEVTAKQSASAQIPVIIVKGSREGPTLTVTSGVHATEYTGVEAAIRISKEIRPQALRGTLILIPVVNLPAFYSRVVGVCPVDGVEIFRAFPGSSDGSMAYAIANKVFETVLSSDFAIDLHGGEMIESMSNKTCWYCDAGGDSTSRSSKELATAFGLPNILDSSTIAVGDEKWAGPRGTMMYEASARGVPTIIGEAGGEGKIDEVSVKCLTNGIRNALTHVGMLEGRIERPKPTELFDLTAMIARVEGIFYSKVSVSDRVHQNQLLGESGNVFGERLEEFIAPFDGVVHVLPANPIVRKGDAVIWLVRTR